MSSRFCKMKSCTYFLMVLTLDIFQASCHKHADLISSYLEATSTKQTIIFGCFGKNEKNDLAKVLMSDKRAISIFNLNRPNVHRNLETRHNHLGVVLDGDCPNVDSFLIICGQLKFFDVKHHWLIFASSANVSNKFEKVILNINADIHVAVSDRTTSTWTIFDLYNPASEHGGVLNVTEIGVCGSKLGYKFRNQDAKYWSRKNTTGVTFRSMVVLPIDFRGKLDDYLRSDDNRDVNTFNRFHARLSSFCRDYYNYSVNIEVVKSWGYTTPDGTFDGMVGALERKRIDFGSSPLFLREDRARVIDYGRNTWILRATFIFRNPKLHTSMEIFLRPLPTSAWLITAFLAIVSIVIFKTVTTYERRKYHRYTETSWGVSVIMTLGAFCQQGSPSTPRMTCGRITTISIFLLSILIYQFYSASLVSHLLNKPLTRITNLKELLESSLKAGCEDILYDRDYFQHTTDEVAIELLKTKIMGRKNASNFLTPEKGLKLVEQGGFAFHVETATAYPLIEATFPEKPICELREVQLFRTQPMHANYQKQSPFREMFDACFQRLAEHGLLDRERRHWHPRKPECIQSPKSISFHVGLDELYPALVMLSIGVISSLSILVVEKQIHAMKGKSAERSELPKKGNEKPLFPFAQ